MLLKSLLFTGLAATGAFAQRSCSTPQPSDEQLLIAQNFQILESEAALAGNSSRLMERPLIRINTYFHILATSKDPNSGGYIDIADIREQLLVLNRAFAPSGIFFLLKDFWHYINPGWANSQDELGMKRALRKGSYADLNVYFQPGLDGLGVATYPRGGVAPGSDGFYSDGARVKSSTVPGGSEDRYNLGHTLTHEVGHWLGLFHTFNEGCGGGGDYVDDTPAEASAAYGCARNRDSCPNQPGRDPVENYMDYSDDACFTGFTNGQTARMQQSWDYFRSGR